MAERRLPLLMLGVLLAGCYDGYSGEARWEPESPPGADPEGADDDDGADGDGDGDGEDPEVEACSASMLSLGPSSMLRLSRAQYANTLRDLFDVGDLADELAQELPADQKLGAFTANASGTPQLLADAALRNAEVVADDVVARLPETLPCSVEGDLTCAEGWIADVAPRAYRRALSEVERETFLSLFEAGAESSFDEGVRRVVAALLSSPSFMYRIELGEGVHEPGDSFALTHYEVASRMSFLLWDAGPDGALLEAAEAGELEDAQGRAEQVERMLADPKARKVVARFHREWLGVEAIPYRQRDPERYPSFDEDLAWDMLQETDAFVEHIVFDEDGSFESLLTANETIASDEVLRLYGMEPEVGRDPLEPVELNAEQRGGLLTRASFLTATSHSDQASPILRGIAVREEFYCQGLPPPPPAVNDEPPEVDENATTRERFAQHTADPSCAGCHVLVDPIGFGLSNYDAVGAFIETENGQPIDASGEVVSGGGDGTFDGGVELGGVVAQSEVAQRCYAKHWFSFANGRTTTDADSCELDAIYAEFADDELRVTSLIHAVVESPSFTHRVIAEVES